MTDNPNPLTTKDLFSFTNDLSPRDETTPEVLVIPTNQCFECGFPDDIHMHHVVPRLYGGTARIPLCIRCHSKVHDRAKMASRALIREGLKRAKKNGKILGRPKGSYPDEKIVSKYPGLQLMLLDGYSVRLAAKKAGVSKDTVERVRAAMIRLGIIEKKEPRFGMRFHDC